MVISQRVHSTFFTSSAELRLDAGDTSSNGPELVRLAPSIVDLRDLRAATLFGPKRTIHRPNLWSVEEHERFLRGLELFPNGPWRCVAEVVGTRTTRQTMTHAQKYRQKILRRRQQKNETLERPKRRARRPNADERLRGIALEASRTTDMDPCHLLWVHGHQELETGTDSAVMTECAPDDLKHDLMLPSPSAAELELYHGLDALQVLFAPIQL